MFYKLFNYYFEHCTTEGLVIKPLKGYYLFMKITIILSFLSIIPILYIKQYYLLFASAFLIIFSFYLFTQKAKGYIKVKFGFSSTKGALGGSEFIEYKEEEFMSYLQQNNLDDIEIYDLFINKARKNAGEFKINLFRKGIIAAAIAPVWVNIVNKIFEDLTTANQVINTSIIMIITIIGAGSIFWYFKTMFSEIVMDYLNKESNKHLKFAEHLERIKFQDLVNKHRNCKKNVNI